MAARYLRFELRGSAEPMRAPRLERLLARADQAAAVSDWRADAFRVIGKDSPPPSVAVAAYRAAGGVRRQGSVFLATPVHYVAELANVRLPDEGILSLGAAQAQALALDFNKDWRNSGVDLWAASGRLFCRFDAPVEAATHDPELMRGRHLESFLPAGPDAKRLRALTSEMEMWLFDHPVNRVRRLERQLPLSALWLWGGGASLSSLPEVLGSAAGGDALFDAYPPDEGRSADIMILHAMPNAPEWLEMEARWLTPTLAELRRGRIDRLELSAGEQRFVVSARWRRRFWRRAKPWWNYFE